MFKGPFTWYWNSFHSTSIHLPLSVNMIPKRTSYVGVSSFRVLVRMKFSFWYELSFWYNKNWGDIRSELKSTNRLAMGSVTYACLIWQTNNARKKTLSLILHVHVDSANFILEWNLFWNESNHSVLMKVIPVWCKQSLRYGKTTLVPFTWNLTEVNNIYANGTYHEVKWGRTTFCLTQFFLWLVWLEIYW